MRHQPACEPSAQVTGLELVLRCVGILSVIGGLPFRLCQMGAPLSFLSVAQIEGNIGFALSAALYGAMTVEKKGIVPGD